jgi:hypothetical protein
MDTDNLNLLKCEVPDKWNLRYINNANVMNTLLKKSSRGQSSTMVAYPFFMVLLSSDEDYALQYNNGRFSVSQIGNYDTQKWDVSDKKIPKQQLFVNDIYDGPLDKIPYSQDSNPKERVKLNLNVNDETLKNLLKIDSTHDSDKSNDACDTFIPRSSVANTCTGCKY